MELNGYRVVALVFLDKTQINEQSCLPPFTRSTELDLKMRILDQNVLRNIEFLFHVQKTRKYPVYPHYFNLHFFKVGRVVG